MWRIYEETRINKLGSCFGHHMTKITRNWIEKVEKVFILQYLAKVKNSSLNQQQNERESTRYFWFRINVPPTTPITTGRASYCMDSRFSQKILVSLKKSNITIICGLIKKLYMVLNTFWSDRFCKLCKSPTIILIFHLKTF